MFELLKSFIIFNLQGNLINENVVIFIVSTTGQGDPPDNMKVYIFYI